MPSRADMRVVAEHVLRTIVIGALGFMLGQSLREPAGAGRARIRAQVTSGALASWSRSHVAPGSIHVEIDSAPSRVERDWLAALRASGSNVSWSGNVPAVIIDAHPVASPAGGIRMRIAAPAESRVEIADEAGVIDTIEAAGAGASLTVASTVGRLTGRVAKSAASAFATDSITLRKLLVIGNAGWESKFVVAALEESGWKVDAFIRVAPGVEVTQGAVAAIDTARYSAVVALDNSVAPYADRLVGFARSGGGVVLAPAAAAVGAIAPLRAGGVGDGSAPAQVANISGAISRGTLVMAPIIEPRSDAIPLERRSDAVAVAARRFGAGRVVQSGYEDTWRWRMAGAETSVGDHRGWWTELVSNVAYAPRVVLPAVTREADDAPVAELVSALGPQSAQGSVARGGLSRSDWLTWMFVLVAVALIAEVASRRLRGAR